MLLVMPSALARKWGRNFDLNLLPEKNALPLSKTVFITLLRRYLSFQMNSLFGTIMGL